MNIKKTTTLITTILLLTSLTTAFSQVADRLYKPNNTAVDTVNPYLVTATVNPTTAQQPSMYSVNKNLLKWNTSQIRGLRDTIINIGVGQGFIKKTDTASMLFPYLKKVNFTWTNLLGKPTLSGVATSGDYNDLINRPNLSLYYLASNPSGYISSVNSSMITGALGYTPYNGTVNPLGFITSETDPTVPSYSKSLNSFSVIKASTDPLYKSVSYTPSNSEVITAIGYTPYNGSTNPNGYITGYTETDPIYSGSSWFSTTNNSSSWNTAFSWGNHATAGYLLSSNFDTRFATKNTDHLTEGSTNLYFTNTRALTATATAYKSISYTPSSSEIISALGYTPANIRDTIGGSGNNTIMTTASANNSLNGKVNNSNTITINGSSQTLGSNPNFTVQSTLVSGTNIKTVGGVSILGSGNISVGTGTVTSVGITGSDFSVSNSPVTTSGNIGLSLVNSGVTAGTYNGSYTVNAKGIITSANNVTINSNVSRSLSNATGTTNQYTISSTRNARVYYSINVSWSITALVSTSSTILLEYSTDGGSNWVIANQVSKNVNLGLVQSGNDDLNVCGSIPANALVRIRPSVATNATITYVRGQEELY